MLMQLTETTTRMFDPRPLGPSDADAVGRLTDGSTLPHAPALGDLLQNGQVIGDYAGSDDLQAATALLPLNGQGALVCSLRAAGFGADGQGAVFTPLCLKPGYGEIRRFLRMALRWAAGQYASYHLWAVLPFDPARPVTGEELCAQYLAAELNLRGLRAMDGTARMLVFSAAPLARWEEPTRRIHLADAALARFLERGYAASEFGWDRKGLLLELRPVEAHRRQKPE